MKISYKVLILLLIDNYDTVSNRSCANDLSVFVRFPVTKALLKRLPLLIQINPDFNCAFNLLMFYDRIQCSHLQLAQLILNH